MAEENAILEPDVDQETTGPNIPESNDSTAKTEKILNECIEKFKSAREAEQESDRLSKDFTKQAIRSSWEAGKHLHKAKKIIKENSDMKWEDFVSEKTGVSQSTADRYIKVYQQNLDNLLEEHDSLSSVYKRLGVSGKNPPKKKDKPKDNSDSAERSDSNKDDSTQDNEPGPSKPTEKPKTSDEIEDVLSDAKFIVRLNNFKEFIEQNSENFNDHENSMLISIYNLIGSILGEKASSEEFDEA